MSMAKLTKWVYFSPACLENVSSTRRQAVSRKNPKSRVKNVADRGMINSILRLEGITDYITITIDAVVCEKGQFKI